MRILFAADLHLNIPARHRQTGRTALEDFAEYVTLENPDAVVVAGDLGVPSAAEKNLQILRKTTGSRPLAICLGNHDFWLNAELHSQFQTLDSIVDAFWKYPAKDLGVVLLDRENAEWGEVCVVGGYGHFDLGLAVPELVVGGIRVTESIYLSGGLNGLYWNDFRCIPNCASRLHEEAQSQAEEISMRLDRAVADGKRVLIATHTCPWKELNGHPLGRNEADILSAYSGNSLVGTAIAARASAVRLAVCGHTHMPVRQRELHGITSLNIGSDYGIFRGVIFDTGIDQVRWIGEPFPTNRRRS